MDISAKAGSMSLYISSYIYIHAFPSTPGIFKRTLLKVNFQQAHIGAMFWLSTHHIVYIN